MRQKRSIELLPEESGSESEPLALTSAGLGRHNILGGRCARCGHEGNLDPLAMQQDWPGRDLRTLQPLLRCSRCRNLAGNKFIVSRMSRD